jgi:hypothetical protein
MKALASALCVLSAIMLFSAAVHVQSPRAEQPRFQIEIQDTGEGGPRYTVKNLTDRTVTACVLELSSLSQGRGNSQPVWDALLQDERPIEPGARISQYLSHVVGGPLPDKVEVIAGVWADGETFGQAVWVNIIPKTRATRALEYEQPAAMLEQGLAQNWTRDQYLQALSHKPNSGPIHAVRSTLAANQQFAEKPRLLRHAIQMMLESLVQKSDRIRKAKPTASSASPG